ncbi:Gfo/Idh/MocA family oxidoreductase [Paenibacillus yanchengensis]|uniref:Gfo/Idh/MocA family oxidoreductase n=1 Tax=Paenibacillus yanchengensis TaxID=2035833 RepID=A0ABW4YQT2_9BACL
MTVESKKHGIVIVGYGGMGSYHAKLVKDNQSLEIIGTYDILEERRNASVADGYKAYESFEQVLNDPAVGTIIIATPNDIHKEIAVNAFRAGKHVICEKPVTLSVADFEVMVSEAKAAGKTLMVHQNRRWDEDFLIIKRMYNERTIGDLFRLESRVHGANGIPGDWRHMKEFGGGMLLDWGVHLLDQVLYMVDSKITSLTGRLSFIMGNEVDDGFEATLEFENGVSALIEVGTTNFITLPRWYVKGTEGTAIIEDWSLKGKSVCRNNDVEKIEPTPIRAGAGLTKTMAPPSEKATITKELPEPLQNASSFFDNFAAVIHGEAEPIVKNDEVLRVLNLIEAIFESAEKGETLHNFDIYSA